MSQQPIQLPLPGFEAARVRWQDAYGQRIGAENTRRNRSGVEIQPLYTPADWSGERYLEDLGFPGQTPMTRGIYPSMHRGRSWSQRQLIGLGTPQDYNGRLKRILDAGGSAVSLIPCNSVYRGLDADPVPISKETSKPLTHKQLGRSAESRRQPVTTRTHDMSNTDTKCRPVTDNE